ncbi:MAG: AMP-binding protein [Deltaproteobacteria bacterium]|nr:AMP-binding protein [Deltaproteobacteria bacterium]
MAQAFATIIEAFLAHARARPEASFATFIGSSPPDVTWTFGQALEQARRAAGGLVAEGLGAGDRVVIVGGNEPAVAAVLLGAMGRGMVPAVVHPPIRAEAKAAATYLENIVVKAEPALVVVASAEIAASVGGGRRLRTAAELLTSAAPPVELQPPAESAPAYIQFSSGSTGAAKAVLLCAGAQAQNAYATGVEIRAQDDETWVIWLPLYHDMGLMSGLLIPLFLGHRTVLLAPERFVERPVAWLQAIDLHRGTLTVAPNFAYALVARRASPERLAGLDLSCLRVAFNGAEMVLADTVARFEAALAPVGLRPDTVFPVYGLAEFTLSACYWDVGRPILVDHVARGDLARGYAAPALENDRRATSFVSVGHPVAGHRLRVVDDRGQECQEREVGEIQLAGRSRMLGYVGDPALSAATMAGEWLLTGDLGYVAAGQVFVCGRKKDLVIRFGENFYPADLESVAATAPGVRAGRLAVLGVADLRLATERVWLVIEAELEPAAAYELAAAVRAFVLEAAGFKFDGISVVPPGFIDKTSSGKVRRYAVRDKLLVLFGRGTPPPSVGRFPEP